LIATDCIGKEKFGCGHTDSKWPGFVNNNEKGDGQTQKKGALISLVTKISGECTDR
jgi:hypothetical protein